MKKRLFPRRGGPDILTEELVSAFSGSASFEFKPLFLVVHNNLRNRNAANGGEEMLRLRLYEKLQNLVRVGGVEKKGKEYKGCPAKLLEWTEQLETARNDMMAAKAVTAAAAAAAV